MKILSETRKKLTSFYKEVVCKLEKTPQKDLLKGNKPLSCWRKLFKRNIMYTCYDIAHELLKLGKNDKIGLDSMKLLKLTYIVNGYYLGFYDNSLFDNKIEAWRYGPVIPDLYNVIKKYGDKNVPIETISLYSETKINEKDLKFLKAFWKKFKNYSALELSNITHEISSPWEKVYIEDANVEIKNDEIKKYYHKIINNEK